MRVKLSDLRDIDLGDILPLYKANGWSAAEKPAALCNALKNSHTLLTAWEGSRLVGLGTSISDGYLVVYYPHLIVHPDYQRKGIGQMIMKKMLEKYQDFHMQVLTADMKSVGFYEKAGFKRAGDTQAMWIYHGREH